MIKICQELFHLHATYNILAAREDDSDQPLAVVKKQFAFCYTSCDIDSVYGQYALDGTDILDHDFILQKDGRTVAIVSKKFFSLSDSYGVEIAGEENHAFVLALAIVLDQILYDRRR